jgi:hypothetical protein
MRYHRSPATIVEIHIIKFVDAPEIAPMTTSPFGPRIPDARKDRQLDDRQPLHFRDSDFYMGQ